VRGATSSLGFVWDLVARLFIFAAVLTVVGASLHAAGHVSVATVAGARVVGVNVLGVEIVPHVAWRPRSGSYGWVHQTGALTPRQIALVQIAGSGTTWLVSLLAALSYRLRRRLRGPLLRSARLALACLWADVVIHTLPVASVPIEWWLGLRRGVHPFGELHAGAVALGMPTVVVLALVFATPLLVAGLISWGKRSRSARQV